MTTLIVNSDTDFTGAALSGVSLIDFTNITGSATATFAASQFDNVQIATDVSIAGSTQSNAIVINLPGSAEAYLYMAAWTFTNWGADDTITVNGSSGNTRVHWERPMSTQAGVAMDLMRPSSARSLRHACWQASRMAS